MTDMMRKAQDLHKKMFPGVHVWRKETMRKMAFYVVSIDIMKNGGLDEDDELKALCWSVATIDEDGCIDIDADKLMEKLFEGETL